MSSQHFVLPFSFFSSQRLKYNACYEWRKIVLRNDLWKQLPQEMIESVARFCTVKDRYHPSGHCNFSRIDNCYLEIEQRIT